MGGAGVGGEEDAAGGQVNCRFKGRIAFPRVFWLLAEEFSSARDIVNSKLMEQRPEYQRAEVQARTGMGGLMGEMIAAHYLTENNIDFKMAPVLSARPTKGGADFILNFHSVDAKYIGPHNTDWLINQQAHKKMKAQWYMGVYVLETGDNTALIYLASWKDVDGWPVKEIRFGACHYLPVDALRGLAQAQRNAA